MKPVYIYFSFRHFQKSGDRMVVATAAYAEPEGKTLLGMKVVEVTPWSENNYVKVLQSYANALNYIYEKQETLKKNGYDQVVLMTSNKILYGWLINNECNSHHKWFKLANRPFRTGAKKELTISTGLGVLTDKDLAYKYCKLEMVNASLKQTYRGVTTVAPEDAEQIKKDKEKEEDGIKMVSIDALLAMDDMAADISFDGFIQE